MYSNDWIQIETAGEPQWFEIAEIKDQTEENETGNEVSNKPNKNKAYNVLFLFYAYKGGNASSNDNEGAVVSLGYGFMVIKPFTTPNK